MSGYGHNSGGFSDYWQLRMAVWDSKEPLVVKAMALAILEYMRPDNLEAPVSRRRIMEMCGISENTLERHWGAICQWIEVIKANGKANVYRARVFACASELVGLLETKAPPKIGDDQKKAPPMVGATSMGVPPRIGGTTTPHRGGYPPQTTPLSGGYYHPPELGVVNPPYKERASACARPLGIKTLSKEIESTPPTPPRAESVGEVDDLVQVNCKTIRGPGFVIDLKAAEYDAALYGVSPADAKNIAEAQARHWAANGERPSNIAGMLRGAFAGHRTRQTTHTGRQQQFTLHGKDLGTIPGWREEQLANKRRVDEALEQYKREREARV